MCLYPKLVKNPKYIPNKKNKGIIPKVNDPRVLFVPIACGKCMECMRSKAREWRVRLHEEIRNNNIIGQYFKGIKYSGNTIEAYFTQQLNTNGESELSFIVSTHDGKKLTYASYYMIQPHISEQKIKIRRYQICSSFIYSGRSWPRF